MDRSIGTSKLPHSKPSSTKNGSAHSVHVTPSGAAPTSATCAPVAGTVKERLAAATALAKTPVRAPDKLIPMAAAFTAERLMIGSPRLA